MRIVYNIKSEKRKQDIYAAAKNCVNTTVYGSYEPGFKLIKYILRDSNILLAIKV